MSNLERMQRKLERALHDNNDCFTFRDIMDYIADGKMQSFAFSDTWVITQVHDFPQRKSVDITFAVGDLDEVFNGLPIVYDWAKSIGADLVTSSGREGWRRFLGSSNHEAFKGWRRIGSFYSKDLRHE